MTPLGLYVTDSFNQIDGFVPFVLCKFAIKLYYIPLTNAASMGGAAPELLPDY
jgi:hypothetical protein